MTGQYRCTYTGTVGNTGVSIQGLGSTGVRKQYGQYRCTGAQYSTKQLSIHETA